MKAKKALLPIFASALLLTLGLTACGNKPAESKPAGDSTPAQTSEEEEVKINITSEGDKKEIIVGETLQLRADQEGVTWGTRNTEIVSVSETGLVTALAVGSARVTAEKEGFARGSFTVTVAKAPEREAKYKLHLEDAEHYSPEDQWGNQWNGYFDSPIETYEGGSDGTSLGYMNAGCVETLTFTSDKAAKVELGISMAFASEIQIANAMAITFNTVAFDLTGKVNELPETENDYHDFHTVMMGECDIIAGTNVLVITMTGMAPNLDDVNIYTEETLNIQVVKPVVLEKIVVAPTSVALTIGETQQLTTETAGVTYTSSDATIAEVSSTGLITAKAAGSAEIVVSKEGMRSAKVSVRVKAPTVVTTYELVENTAVRMEFEAGEFYCEAGKWGMDLSQWGMGWMGPSHDGGETPIEDVESASGGMSLGYFNQTSKVTLKFNSPKAGTINLVLCGAQASAYDLAANITIKVNTTNVDLTGKVLETTGYTDWQTCDLGSVAVNSGLNTLVLEVIGQQGPNLDYIEATLA